jgi:molybdopterin converting factor subunit 1
MTVTVRLFAAAQDLGGECVVVDGAATVADVRRLLGERVPGLVELLNRCAVAVNHEYAEDGVVLAEGDEVAVIPPVSGG